MIMFKIVALVYIIVAGQPIDEPLSFTNKLSFAGLDKCQEYMKSPEFAAQRIMLSRRVEMALQFKQEADAKSDTESDDAPPRPGVAITTSCEEDNRV